MGYYFTVISKACLLCNCVCVWTYLYVCVSSCVLWVICCSRQRESRGNLLRKSSLVCPWPKASCQFHEVESWLSDINSKRKLVHWNNFQLQLQTAPLLWTLLLTFYSFSPVLFLRQISRGRSVSTFIHYHFSFSLGVHPKLQ